MPHVHELEQQVEVMRNQMREEREDRRQVDEEMRVMREQMRGLRERLDNTTESVVAREERNREARRVVREKTREIDRLHDERAHLLERAKLAGDQNLRKIAEDLALSVEEGLDKDFENVAGQQLTLGRTAFRQKANDVLSNGSLSESHHLAPMLSEILKIREIVLTDFKLHRFHLKPDVMLETVIGQFAETELASSVEVTKFSDLKLKAGRPKDAALGVHKYINVADKLIWSRRRSRWQQTRLLCRA